MLVSLAVALILACLPQQVSRSQSPEDVKSSAPQKPRAEREQIHQIEPIIVNKQSETQQSRPEGQEKKNSNQQPSSYTETISAYSTLVIAFFTLITTGAFFYQIRITHNAERSWIGVDNIVPPEHLAWVNVPRLDNFLFEYTFRNRGRTHARINYVRIRFRMIEALEVLPRYPEYGTGDHTMFQEIPPDGMVYPPQESFIVHAEFEGPNGEKAPTSEQIAAIRNHQSFLVSYGKVLYKDAFKRKHETRFCYVYSVQIGIQGRIKGEFHLGGPSAYNKTT
jgi:hypothetical protein